MSGMISKKYIIRPLDVFEQSHVHIVHSKAKGVDLKNKVVNLENGGKLNYEVLIFSQGAKTNFFGLKNAEKNTLQFKNYQDVEKIQKIFSNALKNHNKKGGSCSLAIIGGGATGTELAFSFKDYVEKHRKEFPNVKEDQIKISIFQSPKHLVKGFHPSIGKIAEKEARRRNIELMTGKRVIDIKDNKLFFKEGKPIGADLVVWVAGVIPNIIPCSPELELNRGAIPVEKTLELKDYKGVFAIGDCNYSLDPDDKPYPTTAQTANQQAIHVAKNVDLFFEEKKLKKFNYRTRGVFLALGHNKTAAQAFGFVFGGKLASLMRDVYYRFIFSQLTK